MQNYPLVILDMESQTILSGSKYSRKFEKNVICLYKVIFTYLWHHYDVMVYGFPLFFGYLTITSSYEHQNSYINVVTTILYCNKFVVVPDKSIYLFIKSSLDVVMTSFNRGFIKEIPQKHEK